MVLQQVLAASASERVAGAGQREARPALSVKFAKVNPTFYPARAAAKAPPTYYPPPPLVAMRVNRDCWQEMRRSRLPPAAQERTQPWIEKVCLAWKTDCPHGFLAAAPLLQRLRARRPALGVDVAVPPIDAARGAPQHAGVVTPL